MSTRLIVAGRNRLFCEGLADALSQTEGFRATYHLCEEIAVARSVGGHSVRGS